MKSKIWTVFLAAFLTLSGCKEDKPAENNNNADASKLNVVMSIDYAPFEFYKNGQIIGFDVDFINKIGEKLGRTIVIKDSPFESLIAALQSNTADLVISALSATDERKKSVDFSVSYAMSQSVIVTADPKCKSVEDFKGKKVGVQLGSSYEPFVKEWIAKTEGLSYEALSRVPDLVQNLKSERISGIVMGIHEAKTLLAQVTNLKNPLHIIEIPDTRIDYAIALPKNSPLKKKVDDAIEQMREDGTLLALTNKWFAPQEAK